MKFTGIQKLNIFRIIQEAVNNALKHANASSINIIVRHDLHSHKMFFFISDDGQGIEASRIQQEKDNSSKEMSSHYGLEGMKYRADMLNAELQISSSSEMGTKIKLIVPIE
ncbi:MAG: ATP-binding protein [Treponema sp.]|nr:ATP-binding protein [Candidatus Treponema equi]